MADFKMPTRRQINRNVTRLIRLSRNAEVNRLARIIGQCNRLRAAIRAYRRDHPPVRRCPCCDHIRARGTETNNLFDNLAAVEVVLYSCAEVVHEERPMGRADVDAMHQRDREFLRELKDKASN